MTSLLRDFHGKPTGSGVQASGGFLSWDVLKKEDTHFQTAWLRLGVRYCINGGGYTRFWFKDLNLLVG